MVKKLLRVGALSLVAVFGAVLHFLAQDNYPGSKLLYTFFSIAFGLMLLTALDRRAHYAYLFLVIALWLGFWGKVTAHLILNYPYVEPMGRFGGTATAWDDVLWVAIMTSLGVMLGRYAFVKSGIKYFRVVEGDSKSVPPWYSATRKWVLVFAVGIVGGVAAVNLVLGINQIGLAPRTILPWPLNALISWQAGIGSALLVAVVLWWELLLGKNIAVSIYMPLIEAFLSTVTLLSRGVYVFHALPQLFAAYENRKRLAGISKSKAVFLGATFVILFVVSISGVTTLRGYMYPHAGGFTTEDGVRLTRLEVLEGGIARVKILIAQGEPQEGHLRELLAEKAQLEKLLTKEQRSFVYRDESALTTTMQNTTPTFQITEENQKKLLHEFEYQISAGSVQRIMSLVVDRWIGVEGVMAVSSFPGKGQALFVDAMLEKREIGKATKFQEICNSHYRWVDANTWQFASLPGAAAFLYLSGSYWVVVIGMMLFTILLLAGEQWISSKTGNPLLCALVGMTMANSIAQFGISPRQAIPFYGLIVFSVLLVSVLQSEKFNRAMQKLRLKDSKLGHE